ncbi:hypothetical protein GBF35_49530 [Nonomuraea phyllanthi]|uniref:hypothetical protein n=1 Tax=Nonomuraea phyllanthi TaxID=2219224 RepID=UPI001293BABC|nr:hypothetical protein [Nonomuraea phyllanthi]QFY13544.1 hypothetical protein GBF35_49530 [Nonomuraea phyllanthi]
MTDDTRADRAELDAEVVGEEVALLHSADDPVAAAAVDAAVKSELLDDAPVRDDAPARDASDSEWSAARRESERQIAGLPAKDRARLRELQGELRTMGAEVWPVRRWWGFEVHLNESAALLAAEIPQLIGESAAIVLGSSLAPAVERQVRARADWITAVARPYGVKLASPWVAPAMLVPAREDRGAVAPLHWAVHEPDEGWSPEQRFVEHFEVSEPALAEFQNRLFIVHRGKEGDPALWWAMYDPQEGWSADQQLPEHVSDSAPALTAYDGELCCVHRGDGDDMLWWTRWDGTSWSPDTRLSDHPAAGSPALAAYDGRLYCVHAGTDAALWWSRWDGSGWSACRQLPDHACRSNPALAVYRGHLYCVYTGDDAALWWTRWDGSDWTPGQRVARQPAAEGTAGQSAAEGPALTVYKDRIYCLYRDGSDNSLWWTLFDGSGWSAAERLPGHRAAEAPAVIAYRDRNATRDQLLCVHRAMR